MAKKAVGDDKFVKQIEIMTSGGKSLHPPAIRALPIRFKYYTRSLQCNKKYSVILDSNVEVPMLRGVLY